jgi:drug/metabolite transporter (DMT)-like permease
MTAYRSLPDRPSTGWIVAAFAAVYIIWGSTYLAIHYAIGTIPPLLMAGARFLLAGAILYGWSRMRGAARPTPVNWRASGAVGAMLLLCGNGGVVWAEQHVPSGATALLIGTVPLWMALLDWLRYSRRRPGRGTIIGLILGFIGMIVLVGPVGLSGSIDPIGAMLLMIAAICWAWGSLYAREAELPSAPLLATAMEMTVGGALLLAAGSIMGEWSQFDPGAISSASGIAFTYLVIFGSLVGFTAYAWLLRVSTPAYVSTYAYVNPVVAVLLGWGVAGESVTLRTLLAAGIIVMGVVVITTCRSRKSAQAAPMPGGDSYEEATTTLPRS